MTGTPVFCNGGYERAWIEDGVVPGRQMVLQLPSLRDGISSDAHQSLSLFTIFSRNLNYVCHLNKKWTSLKMFEVCFSELTKKTPVEKSRFLLRVLRSVQPS